MIERSSNVPGAVFGALSQAARRRALRQVTALAASTLAAALAVHSAADELVAQSGEYRAPLLREGSHVVRVHARVRRDGASGALTALIETTDGRQPGHAMVLLPTASLAELESTIEATGATDPRAEITGQVFVYHQSNYLLLTLPPILIEDVTTKTETHAAPEDESTATSSPAALAAGVPDTSAAAGAAGAAGAPREAAEPATQPSVDLITGAPQTADDGADSARDIISSLERAVGPVARRPELSPDFDLAPAGLSPETRLVDRRGKIRRAPSGAFVFTFAADAEGLADPSMTLLPCLLLERLERLTRQPIEETTVLLSGQVETHRGKMYLLPTSFRIPRERTRLEPR